MNFSSSFCDPLKKDIIDLGIISREKIIDKFLSINWTEHLEKMKTVNPHDIYYSPSISFLNLDTNHGLEISAVGEPDTYEFYVFYKRPKMVKRFFGLSSKYDENYVSSRTGQNDRDVINCLKALIQNDTDFLINKIGP